MFSSEDVWIILVLHVYRIGDLHDLRTRHADRRHAVSTGTSNANRILVLTDEDAS